MSRQSDKNVFEDLKVRFAGRQVGLDDRNHRWSVRVQLEDDFAPWNDGVFELSISAEGIGQLVQVAEEEIPYEAGADITCNIQSLTAMLLGYRRPMELLRWAKIQGRADAVTILDERISSRTTALMDFF